MLGQSALGTHKACMFLTDMRENNKTVTIRVRMIAVFVTIMTKSILLEIADKLSIRIQ